ncbi:hypothetical protein [Nocardia sp. NPDC019395]|uniref:hypothetical protein n=1 Tax=Nocardia sp. NPDC019395 TaxID=3154686 RepID=UPI0033F6F819
MSAATAPAAVDELVQAARDLTDAWRRLAPAAYPAGSLTDPAALHRVLAELETATATGEQVLHQLTAECDRLADATGPAAPAVDEAGQCLEAAATAAAEQARCVEVAATILGRALDGGAAGA